MAVAILAAAGSGERLGAGPKAMVDLAGRPMAAWSLAAFEHAAAVARVVIAAPAGMEDALRRVAAEAAPALLAAVVTGGATRSESVARALEGAGDDPVVLVHDAARPLVTAALVDRCIERLRSWECDGVVAAARMVDTVKEADAGGRVLATLERASLWAVQTPQVFRSTALRRALAGPGLERAYDDAQLVEALGGDVRVIEAPRHNLKVTTPVDLRIAERLIAERPRSG
jgi:2-C-methyl-D-erythritol 4-phosphate cytidylyltransferase